VRLLFCAVARAGDWTIVKYDGRDHVTMRNVAEFYGLGITSRSATRSRWGRRAAACAGPWAPTSSTSTGLKFILSYPDREVDGEPIVSRMDLTKVIEPVLRPSRIRDAAVIDSVVLDPGHGGYDNGAMSIWGCEKTYALDVACAPRRCSRRRG
jgi:N-acetylmuramoyl-L-alanine amidase